MGASGSTEQKPTIVSSTKIAEPAPASSGSNCSTGKKNAKGLKICCVCKETKAARDECIVINGEERCKAFIDAHNECLRAEGFEVA